MYKIFLPNLIYISHNLFISKKINLQKNENEVTNYIDFLENSLKIKFIKSNNIVSLNKSKINLDLMESYINKMFTLKERIRKFNLKTIPKKMAYT